MQVLVIGAGVIGVAIAEAVADAGGSATVLDMRGPGRGATQASAGMLTPHMEADADHAPLLDLGLRSLALYDDYIARLNDAGPARARVEYARTGTLEVALDQDDAHRLIEAGQHLREGGVTAEWLEGHTLLGFEPSVTPAAHGGLYTDGPGFVSVPMLIAALVQRARDLGVVFEWPVEVTALEQRGERVMARSGDRTYEADAVVIASGSWARRVRVAGLPALPMRPVRGQLLHLHWCEGDQPQRIIWGPGCYTVPWSDGSLLVGATVEDAGFDEGTTVAGVQALTSAVCELLPHAAAARLDGIRVGLRPSLPDGLPALGPFAAAPRIVAATGHYRSGILLAPITARLVTQYLLEGMSDPSFAFVSPDRFLGR